MHDNRNSFSDNNCIRNDHNNLNELMFLTVGVVTLTALLVKKIRKAAEDKLRKY